MSKPCTAFPKGIFMAFVFISQVSVGSTPHQVAPDPCAFSAPEGQTLRGVRVPITLSGSPLSGAILGKGLQFLGPSSPPLSNRNGDQNYKSYMS